MAFISSSIARKKSTEISSILGGRGGKQAGLRIVILQISEEDEYSNSNTIVVKSGLKSLTKTSITSSIISSNYTVSSNIDADFHCFLRSCHLCKKPLSPHKDVYMYRGDHGFCSIECRSRQIIMDETKEMETKTKSRLEAFTSIDCHGCETCRLLEDLRQRRKRRSNKFKSLISPTKHQQPLLSFS